MLIPDQSTPIYEKMAVLGFAGNHQFWRVRTPAIHWSGFLIWGHHSLSCPKDPENKKDQNLKTCWVLLKLTFWGHLGIDQHETGQKVGSAEAQAEDLRALEAHHEAFRRSEWGVPPHLGGFLFGVPLPPNILFNFLFGFPLKPNK